MSKYLITGGAGFIGGNFCHYMMNTYPKDKFVCLDALTYAGNKNTIKPLLEKPNFNFVQENICNREEIYNRNSSTFGCMQKIWYKKISSGFNR